MFNAYKRLFDLYFQFYKEDCREDKIDLCSFYRIKLLGMLSLMDEVGVIDLDTILRERDLLDEKFI